MTPDPEPARPPAAPLWRPLLIAAVAYGYLLVRQSPDQLAARWWVFYPFLAAVMAACSVGVWGVQRWRGRVWPWYIEFFAWLGLFVALSYALLQLGQLLRR